MKTVAIVGSTSDEHSQHVARAVVRHGGRALTIETDNIPERSALSWEDGSVVYLGHRLHNVKSVYVKKVVVSLPIVSAHDVAQRNFQAWEDQYTAERERHSFLTSVLRSLERPGVTWVNPIRAIELHTLKLHQVALLRRHRIPVPATLGTNDPAAVRRFARKHKHVIYKPLAGGTLVQKLSAADLSSDRLQLLGNCPVLFQAQIPGDEFRAYILNGKPVAAFQIPTADVVDAREALHLATPATLPAAVWRLCIRAARALGLVFTAVDLRRTARGRTVILELNPTPAISFYDDPVDGPVINHLARFLVAHA